MSHKFSDVILSALIAMLAAAPIQAIGADKTSGAKMKTKHDQISKWFEKTKTYCLGRFLIDVPAQADVVYGPAYLGADIAVIPSGVAKLDAILKADQAETAEKKKLMSTGLSDAGPMLGKIIDGAVPGQKIVFAMRGSNEDEYELRSYTSIGHDLFLAWGFAYKKIDDYQELLAHLNAISRRVHQRADDEIPTSPGMCIDGAFIASLDEFNTERVTLGVRLDDVHFSIDMTAKSDLVESDGLEWRVVGAEHEAKKRGGANWYSRIKVFRRGNRTIGGWTGFEVAAWKPAQKDEHQSHEFAFVSHGEPMNPMLPVLDLALHSGVDGNTQGAKTPSISDAEALALWDRLIGSIRERPTVPTIKDTGAAK